MNKYRIEYIEIDSWGEKDFNWFTISAETEEEAVKHFYDTFRFSSTAFLHSVEEMNLPAFTQKQ